MINHIFKALYVIVMFILCLGRYVPNNVIFFFQLLLSKEYVEINDGKTNHKITITNEMRLVSYFIILFGIGVSLSTRHLFSVFLSTINPFCIFIGFYFAAGFVCMIDLNGPDKKSSTKNDNAPLPLSAQVVLTIIAVTLPLLMLIK